MKSHQVRYALKSGRFFLGRVQCGIISVEATGRKRLIVVGESVDAGWVGWPTRRHVGLYRNAFFL